MKKRSKKLILAKETLRGLERLAQGGTGWSFGILGCGGGNASNEFVANPDDCCAKTTG